MPAAGSLGSRTGTVTAFDEPRGLGEIDGDDGATYPFHCAGIADGSRTIDEGTEVRFDVIAGRLGRWEAWSVSAAR